VIGEGRRERGATSRPVALRTRSRGPVGSGGKRAPAGKILNTLTVEKPPTPRSTSSVNRLASSTRTLSSRVWGPTGLYQSGGAYGFRDQRRTSLRSSTPLQKLLARSCCEAASRPNSSRETAALVASTLCKGVRTKVFRRPPCWLP